MCRIKVLVIPVWLNLIVKELGLTHADLLDGEKLSGILSPRDLLIYKMVQFRRTELFARTGLPGVLSSLDSAIESPTNLEKASCANLPLATLFYGATTSCDVPEEHIECRMIAQDVLGMIMHASDKLPEELKTCSASLSERLVRCLHGAIPLQELAGLPIFTNHVNTLQVSPVSY